MVTKVVIVALVLMVVILLGGAFPWLIETWWNLSSPLRFALTVLALGAVTSITFCCYEALRTR